MTMNMQTINFTFTLDEANVILQALGKQPYMDVHQLIQKIHAQASAQMGGNDANPADATGPILPS
jgi:hypothetical protein